MHLRSVASVVLFTAAIAAPANTWAGTTITSVTVQPNRSSPRPPGTTIRWTARVKGGVKPYSYKWWVYDGAWRTVQDWSSKNTYAWTPTAVQGYMVAVWVRGGSSTLDEPERAASLEYFITKPASGPVTSAAIASDLASPQPSGASIRWTATTAGGVPPYSYKWWIYDGAWRTVQDWSANSTFVWTPTVAQGYMVAVWVRSAGVTLDEPERAASIEYFIYTPIATMTLQSDVASPQRTGAPVVWTANAAGGTPPYTFKWWQSDGSTWQVLQEWSASNRYVWTPLAPNPAYTIRVWARSAGVSADRPDREASAAYQIRPGVTDLTLTPDSSPPRPIDTPITWTATAAGGVSPYRFKWWVYDESGWTLLQDWTTSASYTWRPRTYYAGYRVAVWVRSADNDTDVPERSVSVAFPIQRPADDPSCSYTVVPTAMTVGPDNGTAEVHVTTATGCPWTAAITSGGVVEHIEPDQGIGSARLTLSIANNTSSEPRYGSITVARQRIELTQAGRAPDPVCNYSLSSSLETIPAEGGTRSVDVVTTSRCGWSASSDAGWIHVVDGASGVGPGRVTIAVDSNGGDGRSATLLFAGRGLDVLQTGRDPDTATPILTWQDRPVSVAQGSIVFRPYGPIIWESYPDRHAPALGDCFGNCGAGCSSGFNPCGGRTQWWELQVVSEPEPVEGSGHQDVLCYGDTLYLYDFVRYRAMGRWVYHGHSALGCVQHDSLCPEATWLGCLAFAGCGTEWDEDWSYEDVVIGSKAVDIQELGPGSCE